jgi:nitroreductase
LSAVPTHLAAIGVEHAGDKPSATRWSKKEELGHLIDSAANNHQRIVRAQLEESPAMSNYDGDAWVELHRYQLREWPSLIDSWRAGNLQLLAAAESAASEAWQRTLTIGGSEPLTLGFVFDDYVEHMLNHLAHIGLDVGKLRRDPQYAPYPEKPAHTSLPINEIMRRRWSPRLFDDRAVEREKILTLLEAARWAPSCFNEQPWRYLVFDGTGPEALAKARDCLDEGNAWARKAPMLMLSVARENFSKNEKPNRHGQHDVGLASEDLVLQAVELGLAAHQMAGFDSNRARREFGVPEGYTPMAMIAIGYPYHGDLTSQPEKMQARELGERSRKPVGEIAFYGRWDAPYAT